MTRRAVPWGSATMTVWVRTALHARQRSCRLAPERGNLVLLFEAALKESEELHSAADEADVDAFVRAQDAPLGGAHGRALPGSRGGRGARRGRGCGRLAQELAAAGLGPG